MIKQDQVIIILIIVLIVLHLAILIAGHAIGKLAWLVTMLNLLAASSVLIYWTFRQLIVQQSMLEGREIVFVCFELLIVALGLVSIIHKQCANWNKIFQYVVLGIHLLALLLMLVLMLTFKIKRLI